MSWFQKSIEASRDYRNRASVSEILACFRDKRALLFQLALLITDEAESAQQSVVKACEITTHGNSPFRDWLIEWAKAATIASAITGKIGAIRECEALYRDVQCLHAEHMPQGDDSERERRLEFLLSIDPAVVIAELDPLARAVLVLRLALRSSIQDCVLRLNVPRDAILAANCRAMTWLVDIEGKRSFGNDLIHPPQTH